MRWIHIWCALRSPLLSIDSGWVEFFAVASIQWNTASIDTLSCLKLKINHEPAFAVIHAFYEFPNERHAPGANCAMDNGICDGPLGCICIPLGRGIAGIEMHSAALPVTFSSQTNANRMHVLQHLLIHASAIWRNWLLCAPFFICPNLFGNTSVQWWHKWTNG